MLSFLMWTHDTCCCGVGKEVDVIDGKNLRRLALAYKVPIITTVAGAKATTSALAGMKKGPLHQVPLQDYFTVHTHSPVQAYSSVLCVCSACPMYGIPAIL